MISSSSNNQIKNIVALQKKAKVRNEKLAFVIEGTKMFEETDESNLIKAYVTEKFYAEKVKEDKSYFDSIPYELVTDKVLSEAADTTTPQGVIAIVKQPVYTLEEIITKDHANLLILENVRDPGNLGTIIRTAEGAGVTGVILTRESVDIFNPKVVRATMGALYRMPFVYIENLESIISKLKENSITIYASHLGADSYYDEINYPDKTAVIIGNEANGISDHTCSLADSLIKIPMEGKVESLNAGVAASILMYEIYRQSRKKENNKG